MSSYHGPKRRAIYTTTLHNLHDLFASKRGKNYFLRQVSWSSSHSFKCTFVWIFRFDVNCHKCRQTSRPVVEAEIQICYNLDASSSHNALFFDHLCFIRRYLGLENGSFLQVILYYHNAFVGNFYCILRQDPLVYTTPTGTNTKPCSPSRIEHRRKSIPHNKIQKDSV